MNMGTVAMSIECLRAMSAAVVMAVAAMMSTMSKMMRLYGILRFFIVRSA